MDSARGDISFDVAVVGSGAAGLSAALAARDRGARVLVLEKSPLLGGTTALSGGCVWAPCHHHMAEVGASDSREEALRYIRAVSPEGWHNVEDPLWAAFVDNAAPMLAFLEAQTPLRFAPNREPDPYAEAPGGKRFGRNVSARPLPTRLLGPWARRLRPPSGQLRYQLCYEEFVDTNFYANPKRWMPKLLPRLLWRRLTGHRTMGNALVVGLLKGCLDRGCTIWANAPAQSLIAPDGRVEGVEVLRDGEAVKVRTTKGVVLASGGFEWNAEMMAAHFAGPIEWTGGASTNTGDGQRMAAAAGAKLERMDQALLGGTIPMRYEGRVQGTPSADYLLPHSMIVNRDGRRFTNEKQCSIGLAFLPGAGETALRNLPAWRIYDGQFAAKYPHALPPRRFEGVRFVDRTLEGLAGQIGVDPRGLVETARRLSEFARAGEDADFGRGASLWDRTHIVDERQRPNPALGSIEVPPFYAMPFKPGFLATKGGVRTDHRGRALREDGTAIAGLYAAGSAMANPFGSKGLGAGTTLGPCLTWGYICGRSAMEG